MIKFIVGLKNPGSSYAQTRHNAGAWFIDEFSKKYPLQFKLEKKFHLELAELNIEGQRIFVGKPLTYMNESGIAVAGFAKFYQIKPEEMLIAHDELDFAPGISRLKKGGGHGGHNGLKDIVARMGSPEFYRLRIGIGHPGHRDQVVAYVLQNPRLEDKIDIDHAILHAIDVMPKMFAGDMAEAMKDLNTDS